VETGEVAVSCIDLTGQRFGRLTVLHRSDSSTDGTATWLCRCDCGNEKSIRGRLIRRGYTKSCGCLKREHSKRMIVACNADDIAEFNELCDTLVEQTTRFPVPACDLFAAVRHVWGRVDERRLWRALRLMIEHGRVERSGKPYSHASGYSRGYPWPSNLASCIAEAAATYAVMDLGLRRAA
jgi:hypothetical protein